MAFLVDLEVDIRYNYILKDDKVMTINDMFVWGLIGGIHAAVLWVAIWKIILWGRKSWICF